LVPEYNANGNNKVYEEKLDFVVSSVGHFNAWRLPDYEGLESFKGPLFHSSNWDHSVDLKDKRIALIGNGASGLQVLPSIQPLGSHIDHYARNPTWVVDSFNESGVRRLEPNLFSDEEREIFKNPEKYLEYRKKLEAGFFSRFGSIFKNNPLHKELRTKWTELMLRRVDASLADKIIPDFPPNCRRPTPGPGYLEALSKPNVTYIQDRIQKFTEKGIVTVDGTEREVDIVICSTGAEVNMAPHFPVVANGVDLQTAWKPGGSYGYPFTYLGIGAPGFPNIAWILGPASTGFSGTLPNSVENQVTYIAKLIRKLRSQGIATITPSFDAAKDFDEYSKQFYPRTVWTANDDASANEKNCSSWYNGAIPGGRVVGLFPASAAAVNYILRDPRWEDYEYTYTNKSGNRFAYFGNGWRARETVGDDSVDLTPHLKTPGTVDLRSYGEGWWDV
jgi:cation diffusion facilitator CzcD-associated flavoprotein CzcO